MGLSIIIPTFNRVNIATLTIQTIVKILPKITLKYQIIVINDGDENLDISVNNLQIYKNPKKGVASARNFGVSKAKYPNLLFLDDDMILTEDALRYYFSFFNDIDRSKQYCLNIKWEMPKELILKCKKTNFGRFLINIQYTDMKGWMKNNNLWKENEEFIVSHLASYALAITKENFYKVGGYNETYPYAGFEDYDFSNRIRDAGIKVILNTKHVIYHNEVDRIEPKNWFKRRYNEGATRYIYVKLSKDISKTINPSFLKRIIFCFVYSFASFILFVTGTLNYKIFDRLSFFIYKVIAGAYIWKGYSDYAKKN